MSIDVAWAQLNKPLTDSRHHMIECLLSFILGRSSGKDATICEL